jgi:hypothetical protein
MHRLIRFCRAAAAAFALGLLLAACTIHSDKPLVAASEGAAPLPDAFTLIPYDAGDSGYVPATDPPASFVRNGNVYEAAAVPDAKGPIDARFIPVDGKNYILAITLPDEPGMIYGFAHYGDGVLSIALTPDHDTADALKRERRTAMPQGRSDLRGAAIADESDGIGLTSRAALDYLAHMYADGRLPMGTPSVAYISEDASAPPPARLVPSGEDWIKVP